MSDLALTTLLNAITDVPAGAVVTADTIRAEFDHAQLNTAERAAAFKAAERAKFLRSTDRVVRSSTASRKNGANRVWIRTRKAIPAHPCKEAAS